MSRNFTNSLVFESALDSITETNFLLSTIAKRVLMPKVAVVMDDCGTYLGHSLPISYRAEGYVELETNQVLTATRLNELLSLEQRTVVVRNIQTCTAYQNGVHGLCRRCIESSYPYIRAEFNTPDVGTYFDINPEITVDTEQIPVFSGQTEILMKYDIGDVDNVYILEDGEALLLSDYSIASNKITLNDPISSDTIFVIRYVVYSKSDFFHWIANTYCGSLLGIKPIYSTQLPIRKNALINSIPNEDIEDLIKNLSKSSIGGSDSVVFLQEVKDPVERAIFALLLGSIFLQ